jgi:hypothetical protein
MYGYEGTDVYGVINVRMIHLNLVYSLICSYDTINNVSVNQIVATFTLVKRKMGISIHCMYVQRLVKSATKTSQFFL